MRPWKAVDSLSLRGRILGVMLILLLPLVAVDQFWNFRTLRDRKADLVGRITADADKLAEEIERASLENQSLAHSLAVMNAVREAVVSRNRERLLKIARPVSDAVSGSMGHEVRYHFHEPPCRSLLRVWAPDKYGDDLSLFRRTVTQVITTGKPIHGIEAGRSGLVVRGIVPVLGPDGAVAGSLEVIRDIGILVRRIETKYGERNAIFAPPSAEATLDMGQTGRVGAFTILKPPPGEMAGLVTPDILGQAMSGPLVREIGDTLLTAVPLQDVNGEKAAVYVRFVDIGAINAQTRAQLLKAAALSLSMVLLALGLGWLIVRSVNRPLREAIVGLGRVAAELTEEARKIAVRGGRVAEDAEHQAASIEESLAALTQTTGFSKENTLQAEEAETGMRMALAAIERIDAAVVELETFMNAIRNSGQESQKVIGTINDIALQTGLLSLNASVEAARAGETGAGFAVVATEVRKLATRTAESARDTDTHVRESTRLADEGGLLAGKMRELFESASQRAREASARMERIVATSRAQAEGIAEIRSAMNDMERVTHENAMAARNAAASSDRMNRRASDTVAYARRLSRIIKGGKDG